VQPEFTALVWFGVVIALIPIALWLLRRSPVGNRLGQGRAGTPRQVATLSLAPQSRIVTVEVGQGNDRLWLVLGVTAQGIRTLHTMVPPVEEAATPPPPPAAAFTQLLGRLKGDGGGRGQH
jgi:flagellar protein FliO/FliZ